MLEPILESVRARLPEVVIARGLWAERAAGTAPPRDFTDGLSGPGLSVIAEVKRRSPSAGAIAPDLDPVLLSGAYERGGAAAVSVLTEPDHFGGSLDDLTIVAGACRVPVLRKDFILHPAQLDQARAAGADAVLLIAAVLDDPELAEVTAHALRLGMVAFVEVHDADEVRRAVAAGAPVIGVNNRDLRTFEVDLATAESLRPLIPPGVVAVAESGITGPPAARRMADAGYDAVLVGQSAAQSPDPAAFVRSLQVGP